MDKTKTIAFLTAALVVTGEVASTREIGHTLGDRPHDHRNAIVDSVVPTTASPISFSGAQFQHAVITVKGWNPDAFFIVARSPAFENGKFWEVTDELTESGARAELAKRGYTERHIIFMILKARLKPVS